MLLFGFCSCLLNFKTLTETFFCFLAFFFFLLMHYLCNIDIRFLKRVPKFAIHIALVSFTAITKCTSTKFSFMDINLSHFCFFSVVNLFFLLGRIQSFLNLNLFTPSCKCFNYLGMQESSCSPSCSFHLLMKQITFIFLSLLCIDIYNGLLSFSSCFRLYSVFQAHFYDTFIRFNEI